MRDGLTPVLKKIEEEADALIMGTPIYFWSMTGEMRSFLERLLFAPVVYSMPARSLFPRRIKTAMLYTMNAPEDMCRERGYGSMFKAAEMSLTMIFGSAESFYCYDTCQFPDYSKVVMEFLIRQKRPHGAWKRSRKTARGRSSSGGGLRVESKESYRWCILE